MTYTKTSTKIATYQLYDGRFQYYWTDDQKIGTKMPLNINKDVVKNIDPKTVKDNYDWLLAKDYKIDCENEDLKPEIFLLPSNINFTEISPPNLP